MEFRIRPAHEAEHTLIRDSWTRTLDEPRVINVAGSATHYMRIGADSRMVGWAWFDMHRGWVKQHWPEFELFVATLPAHDEAVGWLALTPASDKPLVLHYVYTIELARGRGVAEALVAFGLSKHDGRPARYSHMTTPARRMIDRLLMQSRTRVPTAQSRGEAVMP